MQTLSVFINVAVTCHYKDCYYDAWSSWSASCGKVYRTQRFRTSHNRQKTQVGACGNLKTSCDSYIREYRNLAACPSKHLYVNVFLF